MQSIAATRLWPLGRSGRRAGLGRFFLLALVALPLGALLPWSGVTQAQTTTTICGKRYVAGGDDVPAGNTIQSSQTYPSHLLNDHMANFGYCLYNTAQNGTT